MEIAIAVSKCLIVISIVVLLAYAVRHYIFATARLNMEAPRDTMEIAGFHLPTVTVLVPMHNEERVAAGILEALVHSDYDNERLEVIAINDRSEDRTGAILDDYAARYPFIKPLHRTSGRGGKPAALGEATAMAVGEIILLFDADYIPGPSLIKMLAAPFVDPQVGAVMGRVVPENSGRSLLASLLALERSAGYQAVQQARYNFGWSAQFGGTVGGLRNSALVAAGGWNAFSLTEDTDITCKLLLAGWRVAYVNRAECYEEVPESWAVRRRQLMRWVTGHTECMHKYFRKVIGSDMLTRSQKADAVFMLTCYMTAPVMVMGWFGSLALLFLERGHSYLALPLLTGFLGYELFANQATFVELGSAAMLDGSRLRVLLLPLNLLNFFSSTVAICEALLRYYAGMLWGRGPGGWQKTRRFRRGGAAPPGVGN